MNSTPLKDARLTIELDTEEARARIAFLEEKMRNIQDALNKAEGELKGQESDVKDASRRQLSGLSPNRPQAGPGKFGLRQVPSLLSAAELAGVIGSPFGVPIGPVAKFAIGMTDQYGAFGAGFAKGLVKNSGLPDSVKTMYDSIIETVDSSLRKNLIEVDRRLKAFTPAFEKTLEMVKAQLLTGGHLNTKRVQQFAYTAYEWEFVQARKDKDIRDKTLKMLGEQAPEVIKGFFMKAMEGKIVP